MGLYAQRKRERDFAEREAAGEDVFSRELTKLARGRIANAIKSSLGGDLAGHWDDNTFTDARRLVLAAEGTPGHISQPGSIAELDILATIRGGEHALAASCIEAVLEAARGRYDPIEGHVAPHSKIDAILREERIAMRLVDGRLIDFSSEELHEEVVAPALRLLGGRDGWQAVEDAYRDALEEIGQNPADAITDSGTALQEALTLAGAQGNALGPLAKSARDRSILAPHDGALTGGIAKIIDWVSADRSTRGDTHNSQPASASDAWLAVHVVGALILRLASAED